MTTELILCGFAFLAGLVDAVVGGGGLIQTPALFLFLPAPMAASVPLVFGTNKMSSICGTAAAMWQYARRQPIPWRCVLPAACLALVFSFLGARAVSHLDSTALKPWLVVLMVVVAAYTGWQKDFGNLHAPRLSHFGERMSALGVGVVIGFYDGFFGPGTGSFLIFIFIGLFGFDFLTASASAKVINFSTNLAAVAWFAAHDHIAYRFALPMAACNILGSLAGARLAILRGNQFVRIFFLTVMGLMIVRFGWEVIFPP